MNFNFQPLTIDLREKYEAINKNTPVQLADYTFTNLWGWTDFFGIEIAFIGENAIIRQNKPQFCYWSIIGDWTKFDFSLLEKLPNASEIFKNNTTSHKTEELENVDNLLHAENEPSPILGDSAHTLCFSRLSLEFAEFIKQALGETRVEIEEARGQWEYMYSKEELTKLSGNRFHKKKNHVNGFYKAYGIDYHPLQLDSTKKGSIEEVLSLQEEWCKWHDCEASNSLLAENDVIFRVVGNWTRLGNLIGGSLYVEDKMVAFTIAEEMAKDTLVIHFEKAKTDYRGSYQAINHAFLNHTHENSQGQPFTHVNREQDMGEAGLRKAKESYLPTHYLKKCTLVLKR